MVKSMAEKSILFTCANPVPEIEPYIEQLNGMLALIKSGEIFAKAGESEKGISDIVNKLLLGAPKSENGICTIGYGDLGIELLDLTSLGNGLTAVVTYEGASLRVLGDASVKALSGEFPAMPQGDYLTADDFAELLDYVATAVEMTTEQSITLNVNGSVLSTDTETYPDGKKYDFEATLGYYSGESFPIHIDAENYNAWISTDAYLHAEINLIGYGEGAQSMWIDAYLADMDGNDELDLYVSISTYEKGAEGSTPLTVLAPAGELMTLISSALPLVGIDVDFVNKLISEKWLDASTTQQLKAIGSSLMLSIGIGDLLDTLEGLTSGENAEGTEPVPATAERNGIFETVTLTDGSKEGDRVFTVALNSEMIYGNGALAPISLAITKSLQSSSVTDENGEETVTTHGYLSNIALNNVWMDGEGVEKLDMNVGLSLSDPRPVPELKADFDLGSLKFSELVEALGLSATHKETVTDEEGNEQEEYALNDYFYIGGSAMLPLNLIGFKYD
ncbi:MAG: hypothetical protein K2L87_00310, partial [Clostridiales bacterium]|nr:hypothetical protein [Clostridiales bacterium]